MCRTRRIKCDETKPTCLQCQKSRRQCPGYKDDFDLVFRNETQATERRAKRATTALKKASTQLVQARQRQQQESRLQSPTNASGRTTLTSSDMSSMSDVSSNASIFSPTSANGDYSSLPVIVSAASIPGQIDTSMEAQAIHFFLSNWVLLPYQGSNRGYLDFLLPLLRTSPPDSHLSLTFSAVGLAALANRHSPGINSKGMLPYAAQKYEKALKRTNEALRDPILAKQDSTLASVLLLGLFEQITSCRSNLMGWGSHVDGAVALIRMRGKKQLRTSVGKGLFIAVRTQMVVNCTSSSKPPLLGVDFWTTDAMKDPWGQEITRLNIRVAELRAEVNKFMTMAPRTTDNMEKVLGLMRLAQDIEDEFVVWQSTLPPEWLPKATIWEGDDLVEGREAEWLVYPGLVECFTDMWQASVWQMSRVSRLFLSGIVVRCSAWLCAPGDYRETPEYATAVSLGSEMLAKIISVIPFLLGWGFRDLDGNKKVDTVDNGDFAVGGGGFGTQKAHPRALGGFFALWPLFTVACSDFADDSQRRWVTGRLRWITEEMGVNQAGVLSQFQLRLPSMVIKRDGMGISAPNARDMAKHSGPTANLPPAARPVNMEKIHNVPIGVKVKQDCNTPTASRTSSATAGSPLMVNGNRNPSMSTSSAWASDSQHEQQNPGHDMGQQQTLALGYNQYVPQHLSGNRSNSRYTSPQPYPNPEHQPDHQAQNPSMFSNPSPSYSQAQNQQFQHQTQGRYASPSYNQTSRNASPSTYSISTMPDTNDNMAAYSTNTYVASFDTSSNGSHTNQYKQQEMHHEPQSQAMQAQQNELDMASRIDRLVSLASENHSPQHSSSSVSPTHTYDMNSTNMQSPQNHMTYQNMNATFDPYNNSNMMDFKQEDASIISPRSAYDHNNSNGNSNSHEYTVSNAYDSLNNTTTTQHSNNIPHDRTSNGNGMSSGNNRINGNHLIRERVPMNAAAVAHDQSRFDWELEMVGREAARGNELERSHFQRQMRDSVRDLGTQRML